MGERMNGVRRCPMTSVGGAIALSSASETPGPSAAIACSSAAVSAQGSRSKKPRRGRRDCRGASGRELGGLAGENAARACAGGSVARSSPTSALGRMLPPAPPSPRQGAQGERAHQVGTLDREPERDRGAHRNPADDRRRKPALLDQRGDIVGEGRDGSMSEARLDPPWPRHSSVMRRRRRDAERLGGLTRVPAEPVLETTAGPCPPRRRDAGPRRPG